MYIILYSSSFFGNPREKSVNSSLNRKANLFTNLNIKGVKKKQKQKKHTMQSKPNMLKTVLLVMLDKNNYMIPIFNIVKRLLRTALKMGSVAKSVSYISAYINLE